MPPGRANVPVGFSGERFGRAIAQVRWRHPRKGSPLSSGHPADHVTRATRIGVSMSRPSWTGLVAASRCATSSQVVDWMSRVIPGDGHHHVVEEWDSEELPRVAQAGGDLSIL